MRGGGGPSSGAKGMRVTGNESPLHKGMRVTIVRVTPNRDVTMLASSSLPQ